MKTAFVQNVLKMVPALTSVLLAGHTAAAGDYPLEYGSGAFPPDSSYIVLDPARVNLIDPDKKMPMPDGPTYAKSSVQYVQPQNAYLKDLALDHLELATRMKSKVRVVDDIIGNRSIQQDKGKLSLITDHWLNWNFVPNYPVTSVKAKWVSVSSSCGRNLIIGKTPTLDVYVFGIHYSSEGFFSEKSCNARARALEQALAKAPMPDKLVSIEFPIDQSHGIRKKITILPYVSP